MWQYDNRMMDILDKDEIEIRECFPTVCPVCGKKKRIYMLLIIKKNDKKQKKCKNLQKPAKT